MIVAIRGERELQRSTWAPMFKVIVAIRGEREPQRGSGLSATEPVIVAIRGGGATTCEIWFRQLVIVEASAVREGTTALMSDPQPHMIVKPSG